MTKRKQRYPQPIPPEVGEPKNARSIRIKKKIEPKNFSQELYLESLRNSSITIGEGPAGAGKTYLVIAIALEKLLNNEVARIVLTRPVVESDEKLGFLPGTLEEKLDPYLLPLYDAIEDHIGPTMAKKLMESGKIEIAPLAYMRGRTFNNCLPPDHLVLLSSNEWVRMDELLRRFENGEKLFVISCDIENGELQEKPIAYAFKQPNQHKKLVKITLENGKTILATPDHKLFTQRGYVPINKLTLNDRLIGLDDAQINGPRET